MCVLGIRLERRLPKDTEPRGLGSDPWGVYLPRLESERDPVGHGLRGEMRKRGREAESRGGWVPGPGC